MKIAVTGSSGGVGRRVVLLALKQGHAVVGIDAHPPPPAPPTEPELNFTAHVAFTYHQIDVREYDQVVEALRGCDAVIQLAGQPNPKEDDPAITHNTNVVITWNVLQAAAQLGIRRIAQASSVNAIGMIYNATSRFRQFPIDESHPCEPDEQYGLSKLICEMQADTILRRYPETRIASLRLHWSIPSRAYPDRVEFTGNPERSAKDLWGYVQEDEGARAFMLAISPENDGKWSGHEVFLIAASQRRGTREQAESQEFKDRYWPDVPVREGWSLKGSMGFFDCSKAGRLLDWRHAPE
ncbi:NAD P-binding protein [Gloeophyllum trabeum ATCC 11539]|uniref:NAD P-binding protein n=1 Tax=Gloeophyllum trabeum (strain ATCC 11539 / FP-39264 / Madison 617) TaxID=670483 RepID=S7PZ50_GLOTA|nr:NAD P-binding protein [Gloeophyllum trabeum ATCC 11539]EPQ52758.1 NAD P-binding protein [Gloeophyllum trabeum ATCC 11539]